MLNIIEDKIDMQCALKQLPKCQAAVLALEYSGYTQEEVHQLLGLQKHAILREKRAAYAVLADVLGAV